MNVPESGSLEVHLMQCATDTRLWLYGALKDIRVSLADLIKAAVARAEAEVDVVMPGFTHLQPAMTVVPQRLPCLRILFNCLCRASLCHWAV